MTCLSCGDLGGEPGPVIPNPPFTKIVNPPKPGFDWMKILYIILGIAGVLILIAIVVFATVSGGSGSTGPTGRYYV